jgi:hypothetical protein
MDTRVECRVGALEGAGLGVVEEDNCVGVDEDDCGGITEEDNCVGAVEESDCVGAVEEDDCVGAVIVAVVGSLMTLRSCGRVDVELEDELEDNGDGGVGGL